MSQISANLGSATAPGERRAHERHVVDEHALLIVPSEHIARPCQVLNISAAGASIECDVFPRADLEVRLVMKGGRVFAAVTAWSQDGCLGLRFTDIIDGAWCSPAGFEFWACSRP